MSTRTAVAAAAAARSSQQRFLMGPTAGVVGGPTPCQWLSPTRPSRAKPARRPSTRAAGCCSASPATTASATTASFDTFIAAAPLWTMICGAWSRRIGQQEAAHMRWFCHLAGRSRSPPSTLLSTSCQLVCQRGDSCPQGGDGLAVARWPPSVTKWVPEEAAW